LFPVTAEKQISKQVVEPRPFQRLFYDAVLRGMQILFCYNQTEDRRPKDKGDVEETGRLSREVLL
jgi:hypothetical protein